MWSPLKENLCDSSMSAAVQELYTGLPVALSTECSPLSDPTIILEAEPEAPAFVLSCGNGLPSEHQRTCGLKPCSQDSHERLDYVGQMPGQRPVGLLSKEPARTEVLAGNEEAQDRSSAEQDYLPGQLRKDAEEAKDPRSVAEEGLGCFASASEAACGSKEEEPRLIPEGRESLPRPFHAERAGSLQSLEESQVNSQPLTENLPNSTKEAPGRKANRTVLFGKAGESSPYVSRVVPPGIGECSVVETVMAKVEVSDTSTLVSLEPVSVADDALERECLRGEEENQESRAATTSALSVSEAGGEYQDQAVGATLGHFLPSHQDQMNLHDNSWPPLELETRDTLLRGTVPKTSNGLFQSGLELGHTLWEEATDVCEVVCEMQEECPLDDGCLGDTDSCENAALLEECACLMSTGERLSAACSRAELSCDSDTEQEIGNRGDHSYSRDCEGTVEIEKGNTTQSYRKGTQADSHSENGQQELQFCWFSREQNAQPQTSTSVLLGINHSSPEGHSVDDLKSVLLRSDSVQRDELQQCSLPKDCSLLGALERNASLWKEAGSSMCFQSGHNARTCRVHFSCDCKSCREPLWEAEATSSQRTEAVTSATSLHAVQFSSTADIHLVSDEENLPIAQHSSEHSFPPESGTISSPSGFLDSLPEEVMSGTCAKLGIQGAAGLLSNGRGLSSARQNCGCIDRSRVPQRSAEPGVCNSEERMAETQTTGSKTCSPSDEHISSLCSAAERCWTISGSICLSDRPPEMRTEINAEQVGGLEMCQTPVSIQIAGPSRERSDSEAQEQEPIGPGGLESEIPEEILRGQQHLSVISSWREGDGAVQAETPSDTETHTSANQSQNESLCLQSERIVCCCSSAQEYPALTVLFGKEGDHHVSSSTSGTDKGSQPPQGAVCGGSPSHSKEVPRSMIGSKAGTVILGEIACTTRSYVYPWRKIKPSLEDHPSQTTEKVELPVLSFSNAVDSSGLSSQGLKHSSEEGEVTVLCEAEACPGLTFSASEFSQSDKPSCVKDPSITAALVWHSEGAEGHAQQLKGLLPTGSPGVLLSTVPSPGGSVSEASPKCFGSQGRHWQSTERRLERTGVKWKSSIHAVAKDSKMPVGNMRVSEMEDCPELSRKALHKEARGCPCLSVASCERLRARVKTEHLSKRRLLRVRQPLSSALPGAPAWQTLAKGRKSKSAWSTLWGSKRPKIAKDFVELEHLEARSSLLSDWISAKSKPLTPVSSRCPQALGSRQDGIQSAFESTHKMQQPCLFRPPGKVWGKHSSPVQYKTGGKNNAVRSLKNFLEVAPLHKSKLAGCVYSAMPVEAIRKAGTVPWSQAPKPRASQSSLLDPKGLGRLTKDQAVLRRLSALAKKLQVSPKNPRQLKQICHSTKLLPLTGQRHPLLGQKLLDIFSCVNLKLNSWRRNDSSCCPKMLRSQSLALFPMESLNLVFWDLSHKAPPFFSAPLFPVLFHIKVGSFPTRSLLRITSLQSQGVTGERDATDATFSWMLSFLFPGSCPDTAPVEEGAWTPTESSLCAEKGTHRGEDATAQRLTGCSTHGLQTILALSSPSWYRFWTRKRRPAIRRILATQKLTVLQIVQGLRSLNCSSPALADFFSSVPHSLGRGLSLWSQHNPSICPSEFPPLHSNHCTWQPVIPATTSLRNSPAVLPQVSDQILGAPWVVAGIVRVEPPFPASLPTPCSVSEPVLSSLRLSAPEFQVPPLDDLEISLPVLPKTGSCLDKDDSEKRPKKVSQIRIRKTIPRPDPNLTPMGLPRPKRLKKKEFSLEEIYTNKNYKSPPTTRCLETIFEEPKEKNGSLISVSQQKRKRILEFQDFTVPRKRRVRSRVKLLGSFTRAQKAALEGRELDVLLIQKLTDLETFFAEEAEKEQAMSS